MRTRLICSFVAMMGLPGGPAYAQDPGKVGITMGFPASIGVLWHATDSLALRPEFTFSGGSSEFDGTGVIETDNWSIATGASVLFYLKKHDNLRTYVTPRIAYTRTESTTTLSSFTNTTTRNATNSLGAFGSFGAQYNLGDKFGVFGELGFGVTRARVRGGFSGSESTSTQWGTRAGVGVVYYP